MALRFFKKHFTRRSSVYSTSSKAVTTGSKEENTTPVVVKTSKVKNKKTNNEEVMENVDKINAAENVLNDMGREVKVVKKEKGLIERTESSKIILTEDNRQVLND